MGRNRTKLGRRKKFRPSKQLQPSWPLRMDKQFGPYTPIIDAAESIFQDLRFLFMSSPGEWPFKPEMGIGLRKYLFESPTSPKFLELKTRIRDQIKKYLPAVEIMNVNIVETEEQENNVGIIFEYRIPQLGIDEAVVFNLTEDLGTTRTGNSCPEFGNEIVNENPVDY